MQKNIFLQIIVLLSLVVLFSAGGIYFLLKEKSPAAGPAINENAPMEEQNANPAQLTWVEAVKMAPWQERDSYAATVFNGKIWLTGGLDGNKNVIKAGLVEYGNADYFSDIWNSEDGKNWQLVTDLAPWGKRRSVQLAIFKEKMWLMGGWGPNVGYKSDIWFTSDGIKWEKATSGVAWPAREGHQLLVFKDKLWLMGGVDYDKQVTKNDVWYSEDGINWTEATKNAQWPSRWDHSVAVFNGKMWLTGGMDLNDRIFGDVWYSEDGINWILATLNPGWQARQGHGSVEYQNRLWVIGRFNDVLNKGPNDVWYSEDGINWQKTDIDPQWPGREDIVTLVFQDKIWFFGGMTSGWKWVNDVWHSTL